MPDRDSHFCPIIYVRGYAMTPTEIDETTVDPFCGFNVGSTVYRAVPDKYREPRKYIFESAVVRLASDFGYEDVYEDGLDILDPEWGAERDNKLSCRSIVVFRYYEEASRLLGTGTTPSIETFAKKLGDLILRVQELVCGNAENGIGPEDFRCYLVAHSMGGLVCRALLQNPRLDTGNARRFVDKLFTYATPHNGISMAGVNMPAWLKLWDMSNFNRARMADYLNLSAAFQATGRVDWLPDDIFAPARVFCMVGTNRMDYEVALGASRTFSGYGSDGLVRIADATLTGLKPTLEPGEPCAKAFAYRSHSGYFGIVNSEEAYQNLVRFLFGDVRVDVWVDVVEIRLPKQVVEQAARETSHVDALYQFEVLASPRGKLWYLTRRTCEEDSVACLTHKDWSADPQRNGTLFLSTLFLANRERVRIRRRSLAYGLTLGVRVPDYQIGRKLWFDEHYEGGYLFRETVVLELEPPTAESSRWRVRHSWTGRTPSAAYTEVDQARFDSGKVELHLPFNSDGVPGIRGVLRFVISAWNR